MDVMPSGWSRRLVKEMGDVKGGKRLPLGKTLIDSPNSHPYIRVADMDWGGVNSSDVRYVPDEVFPLIKNYTVIAGDIFITVAGTIGVVGRIPMELSGASLTENADKITNLKVDGNLLMYYLMFNPSQTALLSSITVGAQPKLALNKIQDLEIVLPDALPEQRAIAAALSDTDALIAGLEALVAKKRAIKQGAMQQLLTGRKRLPGFTGEWEEKRLGNVGKTYGGLTGKSKQDFSDGNKRYITFMNVMSNTQIKPEEFEWVKIGVGETQNVCMSGDLIFNTSSETPEELAMCSLLRSNNGEVYLNSFCFGFRLFSASVDGLYLTYYFRNAPGRSLIHSLAQGATRYNISKANFLKLLIFIPPLREQNAIATVLIDMDAEIESLETQLGKTRALKQGMMQELLTGRIRLV
jgi:type I restriction enzyme, S subunit